MVRRYAEVDKNKIYDTHFLFKGRSEPIVSYLKTHNYEICVSKL